MTRASSARARLHATLELVRVPNLFTAMADAAMGVLFVRADQEESGRLVLGLCIVASTLVYAGGVALNDCFDAARDARLRPLRPIPSGRIPLPVAKLIGWELLLLGSTAAWFAAFFVGHLGPGIVVMLLIGAVLAYDALLKRTPLGPLAMGACRMLNVLLGMSAGRGSFEAVHWLVAGGIGVYIAGVTWFARREAGVSPRWQLAAATLVMLAGVAMLGGLPNVADDLRSQVLERPARWYGLMAILAAFILWRCLGAIRRPWPGQVQVTVAHSIMSLVVLDAAVCHAVRGAPAALAVVLLLVPALLLGQWYRST